MPAHSTSVSLVCCSILTTTFLCAAEGQVTPQKNPYTLQSNVDLVLVPVVVRDRAGRLVGDLTERDFQVFDNNKRQLISGFMLASVAPQPATQRTFEGERQIPTTSPKHFVILLFDDLHVTFSDLARSKEAGKHVLAELKGGESSAVVSLSGSVNSGITANPAILLAALERIRPQTMFQKLEPTVRTWTITKRN